MVWWYIIRENIGKIVIWHLVWPGPLHVLHCSSRLVWCILKSTPPFLSTLLHWSSSLTFVLLVPRNFSRGRGVIPSLAERGGAVLSAWVLPVWNVASANVVRQHNVLYTWLHFKTLHSKLEVPTLTRLLPPLRERWYDPSSTVKVTRH
jgi:hypothetical protein